MTTVAFDGKTMAADTLATDAWGMKEEVRNKVLRGNGFLIGFSGEHGQVMRWWQSVGFMTAQQLIDTGYAPYEKDNNDPAILIGTPDGCYRHVSGMFFKMHRPFHAIGSGRDYALAAMHLGQNAYHAVAVARDFDNGTGGDIVEETLCQ